MLEPFTMEEFRRDIFHMHNDKSPSPDGLNPAFYKTFGGLLRDDIFLAATSWLNQAVFSHNLNNIDIVLIPKKDNPFSMPYLMPISLCNVLYKIVSKVLAKRLKPTLYKCISSEMFAYVEDRSILDNIFLLLLRLCITLNVRGKEILAS